MGVLLSLILSLLLLCAPPAVGRDSAIGWNNRGVDMYSAGNYSGAISAYDKAIKMNPRYVDAYSNRGVAYDAMDQPERAIVDYSRAIELNPSMTASYVNRGLAYIDLARFAESITDWNVVLKRKPQNGDAYYRRGLCYQSMGQLDKALADYEKACKLKPGFQKAQKNRDTIRKALAIAPSTTNSAESAFTPLPMEKQTQVVDGSSKMAQPVERDPTAVKPVVSVTPNTVTPTSGVATASAVSPLQAPPAQAPTGSPSVRRSSAVDPAAYCVAVIRHVEGNVMTFCHQYDAAAASFSGAITMNPGDQFAYYRRGNAYLLAGKKALALQDYEAAIQINPRFKQARALRDKLAAELNQQ